MAEQTSRLTDIEALINGVRWRWGMICVGAVILVLGRSFGIPELTPWFLICFVAVGVFANVLMVRLLRSDWYRWWLTYAYCLIDLSLVALAIVYLGPGSTITAFFLVILPCAFRPERVLGLFALSSAAVLYLLATFLNGLLAGGPTSDTFNVPSSVFLDLVLFVAVALTLMAAHADLFGRLSVVRAVIEEVTKGSLERRTPGTRKDILGHLEHSLNAMLEQVGSTIENVQREADEVVALAQQFTQSILGAGESSRQVASMATQLAQELGDLKSAAEAGHTESSETAQEARSLQTRAEGEVSDAVEIEETAQIGRDRVVRTSESVVAIGADLNRATSIVNELGALSRQIGSAALSIAKVARHTHVLALNAAIEAARAEEHGKEFAVVADQVRTLAGEAGRSAREVGDLTSEVQAGIVAAAKTLTAGEEKVNEIEVIVGEARSALNQLRSGAANSADLVSATAEVSQSQANRAESVADKMSQFAVISTRWSVDIDNAADAMEAHISALEDLDQANQRLQDVADRLRKNVERFSTPRAASSSSPQEGG